MKRTFRINNTMLVRSAPKEAHFKPLVSDSELLRIVCHDCVSRMLRKTLLSLYKAFVKA